MRTQVVDKLVKRYTNTEIYGDVKNATTYIHKGSPEKTFVPLNELHNYNDMDNVYCSFGAKTDIHFQYSILVSLTDYIGTFEKACKEKDVSKGKGKGKVLSVVQYDINAVSRLYTLASYGWKIKVRKDGKVILTTPYFEKLTSFRRVMDGNENYFDIEHVSVNRYDGKDLLNYLNLDRKDIIKECQKQDRDFIVHWISDRIDKSWN